MAKSPFNPALVGFEGNTCGNTGTTGKIEKPVSLRDYAFVQYIKQAPISIYPLMPGGYRQNGGAA